MWRGFYLQQTCLCSTLRAVSELAQSSGAPAAGAATFLRFKVQYDLRAPSAPAVVMQSLPLAGNQWEERGEHQGGWEIHCACAGQMVDRKDVAPSGFVGDCSSMPAVNPYEPAASPVMSSADGGSKATHHRHRHPLGLTLSTDRWTALWQRSGCVIIECMLQTGSRPKARAARGCCQQGRCMHAVGARGGVGGGDAPHTPSQLLTAAGRAVLITPNCVSSRTT